MARPTARLTRAFFTMRLFIARLASALFTARFFTARRATALFTARFFTARLTRAFFTARLFTARLATALLARLRAMFASLFVRKFAGTPARGAVTHMCGWLGGLRPTRAKASRASVPAI